MFQKKLNMFLIPIKFLNFKFSSLNFFSSNKKAIKKYSLHTNFEIRHKINHCTNIEARQVFLIFHKEVYDCGCWDIIIIVKYTKKLLDLAFLF